MTAIWQWPGGRVHHLAASAGPLTFVGGAGDFDDKGAIRNPGDLDTQLVGAVANIAHALEAESCTLADVVRLHVYYAEETDDWQVVSRLAALVPGDPLPVISTVPEPFQPFDGQVVQIQAVARRGWRGGADTRVVTRPAPGLPDGITAGLRAGEFIAIAHRTAGDTSGDVAAPGDGVAQSHAIMAAHEETLAALGAGMQDAVKMEGHFFGTTRDDWAPLALARASHFAEPGPPATVVPCQRLYPEGAVTKIGLMAMREKRNSYDKYIPRADSWPDRVWDWPLNLPYRQAIRLRDMIWLGGQVPSEPFSNTGNRMLPGNLAGQTRLTMSYIEDLLRGFDRTTADLKLMVCYFTSDGSEQASRDMIDLLSDCIGGILPPTTLVPKPMMHTVDNTVEIWGVAQA